MTSLDPVLQRLNRFITLNDNDRQAYTNDFNEITKFIIQKMAEIDTVFHRFLKGCNLGGSYADNLKVSEPNEFDLVIHLKLTNHQLIELKEVPDLPGYVKINIGNLLKSIEKETHNKEIYDRLLKLVDEKKFLIQNKVQSWIESILTRIFPSNPFTCKPGNGTKSYQLTYRKTGPAHTVYVIEGKRKFSIDFVPALLFNKSDWIASRQSPPFATKDQWQAIPKPIKNETGTNLAWITSYVDIERDYIIRKCNLKNTLRMLKKLRDRQNIQNLKSYFIKTVYLWETVEQNGDFWNKSASFVLMHMFEKLLGYVERRNLPFFWDEKFNMFAKLSEPQLYSMYHQLKTCYDNINRWKISDPEKIYNIFLTKSEIEILNGKVITEAVLEPTTNGSDNSWCSIS